MKMLPTGVRRITIAWFKQNSGSYALKGIRVEENGHSYDSSITFRDTDAEWVTRALGAEAEIEFPGYYGATRSPQDYPKWAHDTEPAAKQTHEELLQTERAEASLLRFRLRQLIQACESDFAGTALARQLDEARKVLLETEEGTYYEAAEAVVILNAAKKRRK